MIFVPGAATRLTAYHYDYHDARAHNDRLLADDAEKSARGLGIRVMTVDGSRDAEAVADLVEDHFAPFL